MSQGSLRIILLISCCLLFGAQVRSQNADTDIATVTTSSIVRFNQTEPIDAIAVYDHGKLLVSISAKTGEPAFGEGVTLTEAGIKFWQIVGREFLRCRTAKEDK